MFDKFYNWLSLRLPRGLVYWCGIRLSIYAVNTKEEVSTLPIEKALVRWVSWPDGSTAGNFSIIDSEVRDD